MGSLTAEAGAAGVVEPTQAQVVHPPTARLAGHRSLDLDSVEADESGIEDDRDQAAIEKSGTGGNGDGLGGDGRHRIRGNVVVQAGEGEVAGGSGRVAAKGGAVHVKGEAAGEAMVTV